MSSSDSDSPDEPDIDDFYDQKSNGVAATVPNQAVTPSDVTPSATNGAGILQGTQSQNPTDILSNLLERERNRGDQNVRK